VRKCAPLVVGSGSRGGDDGRGRGVQDIRHRIRYVRSGEWRGHITLGNGILDMEEKRKDWVGLSFSVRLGTYVDGEPVYHTGITVTYPLPVLPGDKVSYKQDGEIWILSSPSCHAGDTPGLALKPAVPPRLAAQRGLAYVKEERKKKKCRKKLDKPIERKEDVVH